MDNIISRRDFIKNILVGFASAGLLSEFNSNVWCAQKGKNTMQDNDNYHIQTVLGPIKPSQLGLTLIHEHILVDFIGADNFNKNRYDQDEVFEVMLPYLKDIRALGVTGFAECTPMYLARDAELMARLSKSANIHILTNTGMYKEPYLPKYAFEKTAEELARMWIDEANNGIESTTIKPGFIKIAVNPGNLIPIQQKIVRAAAITSKSTGLTIACHTGHGVAAIETMDILEKEGVPLNKYIFVHADAEGNVNYHIETAKRGAWVEYDSVGSGDPNRHIQLIKTMLDKGYEDRLLLSQDAGWYNVGQPKGGNIRAFTYIIKEFMPLMEKSGINKETINKLMITNPAMALSIENKSENIGINPKGKAKSTFGKIRSK